MSELSATLEAILFSSNRPLKLRELQQATSSDRTAVEQALDELKGELEGRGVMLMRHHDELNLATRPAYSAAVRRALRPEVSGSASERDPAGVPRPGPKGQPVDLSHASGDRPGRPRELPNLRHGA